MGATMNKISVNLAAFALVVFAGHAHAHSAPLSKAATQACHEKEKSQACHYEGGHAD
jgi:FlaG/FlaF family flagellin (archaellin)